MDIVTHFALGTVVGELFHGKKAGKSALVWGAIAGLFPDIDMFVYPWFEPSRAMLIHRGFSHSFLWIILITPVLGWLASVSTKKYCNITPKQWSLMIITNMALHIVLDLFTNFGTSIFLPFSSARYAVSTIAIVDIFFTLPLLISALWLLFVKATNKYRLIFSWMCMLLSTLYFSFTVINKAHANGVFEKALFKQKKPFYQVKAYPQLPFNFSWICIAKTRDGYWYGQYNQLKNKNIDFRFIARNEYWLLEYENDPKIQRLKRFAKNEYSISKNSDGSVNFNVLRFGQFGSSTNAPMIFSFKISKTDSELKIERVLLSAQKSLQFSSTQ